MAIEFKIIKIRKNIESAFVPSNLLPGELHITTDTGKVHYCYSAGNVKQLATIEQLQALLNVSPEAYLALQQLIAELQDETVLTGLLADIASLQANKLDKIGDSKDNTVTFTEAATETDIVTGESHATLFGKILKSIKTFRSAIGTLSSLKTTNKTSLVGAINEQNDNLTNHFSATASSISSGYIAEDFCLLTVTISSSSATYSGGDFTVNDILRGSLGSISANVILSQSFTVVLYTGDKVNLNPNPSGGTVVATIRKIV